MKRGIILLRILLITNILPPYRELSFGLIYEELKDREADFRVLLMAGTEPDRPWEYQQKRSFIRLLPGKSVSFTLWGIKRAFHFNHKVWKSIREFGPDILILSGSSSQPTTLKAMIYHKLFDKNKQMFFWGESFHEHYKNAHKLHRLKELYRRWFFSSFDAFCSPGKLNSEFVDRWTESPKKKLLLPNLVDEKLYRAAADWHGDTALQEKYGIADGHLVFAVTARLSEEKGILPFLQNTKDLLLKYKPHLLIAGTGDLKEEISRFIAHNRLPVTLLGQMEPKQIVELFGIADFFLLPSYVDHNPLSTIEAAFAGLPLLVSTEVGNYPELVEEGVNGYVFNPFCPENVRDKLQKCLCSDIGWRVRAGAVSLSLANRSFTAGPAVAHFCDELLSNF